MSFVGFRYCVATVLALGSLNYQALAEDPNLPSIHSDRGAWPICRQWNVAETHHYAKWINHIYRVKSEGTPEQRRAKLERVLTDPAMNLLLDPEFAGPQANPQLDPEVMRAMHSILDCGKLTVALSSYYSYRRGLPWMTSYVRSSGGDLRVSAYNIPLGTYSSFDCESHAEFFVNAVTGFCTGNFRVEPFNTNSELSDTVPVIIDPQYLIPGALHYLDGHVLILADVDRFGELRFLDATTAASRDIYTFNGLNAVMGIPAKNSNRAGNEYAGCFQGLRIFRYPIADTDETGKVIHVRRRTDEEMKEFGFSTEQYDYIEQIVRHQAIVEDDVQLTSFHELILSRMRTVDRVSPVEFIESFAEELVDLFKMREDFVQQGWSDVLANGPIAYPERSQSENVYVANGRWGAWSSAASDVDLRSRYYYLADWMDNVIRWYERQPDFVDLTGLERHYLADQGNLAYALMAKKSEIFNHHFFTYTNSKGDPVTLTLFDLEKRLYDLSFDPNHPPELRWGARAGSAEYLTAPEMPTPLPDGTRIAMLDAYHRQGYYRSLGQRETTESYLRDMFTNGYPVREKFDGQLAKWTYAAEPVPPLIPTGMQIAELRKGWEAQQPQRIRAASRILDHSAIAAVD
jgi:hypothetical protein